MDDDTPTVPVPTFATIWDAATASLRGAAMSESEKTEKQVVMVEQAPAAYGGLSWQAVVIVVAALAALCFVAGSGLSGEAIIAVVGGVGTAIGGVFGVTKPREQR